MEDSAVVSHNQTLAHVVSVGGVSRDVSVRWLAETRQFHGRHDIKGDLFRHSPPIQRLRATHSSISRYGDPHRAGRGRGISHLQDNGDVAARLHSIGDFHIHLHQTGDLTLYAARILIRCRYSADHSENLPNCR